MLLHRPCGGCSTSIRQVGAAPSQPNGGPRRSPAGHLSGSFNKGSTVPRTACAVANDNRARRTESMKEERRLVWQVVRHWCV